jgi:uncharacterized MAPEG superfamily protein
LERREQKPGEEGEKAMSVELTMLLYATALLIALVLVQATAGVMAQGLVPMANNRDNLPEAKPFQARMKRVVDNHREGLLMFAPLVLIANMTGVSNDQTVLGAQLFFYARLAHALIYIAGLPMIRPLAWAVGLVGTLMVLAALFGIG